MDLFASQTGLPSHPASPEAVDQHSEPGFHRSLFSTAPIRILVVDDHVIFREGMTSLLASQPDLEVVGHCGSIQDAVRLARDLSPDIVLMDWSLPDGSGVDATQAILAERGDVKIIFLTVHEDDECLFAAIRAGAMGYHFKNVRAAELLKGLREVAQGGASLSPATAQRLLLQFSRMPPLPDVNPAEQKLTDREREVVRAVAQGVSNQEIAERLVISENTVKNHVRNVLAKLHLHNRREVSQYARMHGLIGPSPMKPNQELLK